MGPQSLWIATKRLDFRKRPTSRIGGLMVRLEVPFLPEEVLPLDLKTSREIPGTKPSFQLCHGVVQVITFIRPYCVLKIGFGEK